MLRKLNRLSALALCLTLLMGLLAVPASASYDIYVNAKDGIGLNLRTGPGTEYSKARSQPIPMYTRLSISQTQDSAAGLPWGYTYYQGDSGWVCLVETTTYDPTPQAPAAPPVTQAPEAPAADTEVVETTSPATPEDAPTPPPMERTGSTGATIALSIIIVLLLIVVIFFVVMIIKLKKKP